MEENLKLDKDYKEAFNLGFELAKELNLKSPMFKDLNSGNSRMYAMQAGMAEYSREITQGRVKEIDGPLGLDKNKQSNKVMISEKNKGKDRDRGKGFDLSI